MANITLEEALEELSLVNIAIEDLLQHKTINELKLGNGEFARWYKYAEVTLNDLLAYRRDLRNLINSLEVNVTPVFRAYANIPLIVTKGI